jgi:hypothetical protein
MRVSLTYLRSLALLVFAVVVTALSPCAAFAQEGELVADNKPQAEIDRIIRSFSANETRFRQALNDYAFTRDAVIQTVGMGGQVTGEYHRVSFMTFDDSGNRFERINFFPASTLTEVSFTSEDLEDLGGIQPFALEASKINQYNFQYVGKQKIDDLSLYVFDVNPKVMPNPSKIKERLFQGRIWVDDKDLQIVKVKGKGVPETKNNKYPVFDTYREQIDGRYWFPTYTYADDQLVFGTGNVVHLRMKVTYSNYKQARSSVRITDINGDEVPDEQQDKDKKQPAAPAQNPPKKP